MSPSVSERRDRDETHSEAHPRQWVSFEHDDDTWMFDATFLMSPYRRDRLLYGRLRTRHWLAGRLSRLMRTLLIQ